MAWKIHLKGKPEKVIYDQIRTKESWVTCWHTDEDGHDQEELTKYPSRMITKIEKLSKEAED